MQSFKNMQDAATRRLLYPVFRRYVEMPLQSFTGPLPPLTDEEQQLTHLLRGHVDVLSNKIGVRHMNVPGSLDLSAGFMATQFAQLGYTPVFLPFTFKGVIMQNVMAEIIGSLYPNLVLIYFAHYDTTINTRGADDNASALAILIELARILRHARPAMTIRFVAVANEEHTGESWEHMGSCHVVRRCKERGEKLFGIALEMLGYFSDIPGSQTFPWPFHLFYPNVGNFVAFIGNRSSQDWTKKVVAAFREEVKFPSEGGSIPNRFADINRSDQYWLWRYGYDGVMMTNTSNFRTPHLHKMSDTPETLNYEYMARLAAGMGRVSLRLAA